MDSVTLVKREVQAQEWSARQTEDSAAFSQLGFEERIALIVDAEWNRRQANKLKKIAGILQQRISK